MAQERWLGENKNEVLLRTLAKVVLNRGDEVIIPAPYWVSYPDIVLIAEGKPVIVQAGIEQGFKMTPAQLEEVEAFLAAMDAHDDVQNMFVGLAD